MKILLVNKFFYLKGGPERCMYDLSLILKKKGHKIAFFSMHHPFNNKSEWTKHFVSNIGYTIKEPFFTNIKNALKIFFSFEAKKKIGQLIDDFKPDIVHIHNFNHQLTPSILFPLKKKNIPIVVTLHDYKLVCPSYRLLDRRAKICELCKNGKFKHCFIRKCHKKSYLKSLILSFESYLHHNVLRSYNKIDVFISPSRFLIEKFREMGFKHNMFFLPNFVNVDMFKPRYDADEEKIVYCGRLSEEKGIFTMVEAVKDLNVELSIIGSGPMFEELDFKIQNEKINNVNLLGFLDGENLWKQIRNCRLVIVPSEWYENNPMTILEAFALGKPVIGSKIGGIRELVLEGETGLLFEPGNSEELKGKILFLLGDSSKIYEMGRKARCLVEENFNSEKHYKKLKNIYQNVKNRQLKMC